MSVRPLVSNAIGEMGITQLLLKLNPLFVFLTLWGFFGSQMKVQIALPALKIDYITDFFVKLLLLKSKRESSIQLTLSASQWDM